MTITDSQLKGNWAEEYISSELASQGCFIRRVTQGHDTGIDLYCETVENGIPFMHFWCQIKTSEKWNGKKPPATYSPKLKHIDYWLKQPIPVFIFLVPDFRAAPSKPYYIYAPMYLKGNRRIKLFKIIGNQNHLFMFLRHHLPMLTHEWELREGKVSPLKTPEKTEIVFFEPGITHLYEKEIFTVLHWTLWRLSSDIMFMADKSDKSFELVKSSMLNKTADHTESEKARLNKVKPYIDALNILIKGKKDEHYQGYYTIGLYYELVRKYDEALEYYNKALSLVVSFLERNKGNAGFNGLKREIAMRIEHVKNHYGRNNTI